MINIKLFLVEFSQGLILPTKESSSNLKDLANNVSKGTSCPTVTPAQQNGTTTKAPVKIETKKLTLNEEFKCRADELYRIFTDINVSETS